MCRDGRKIPKVCQVSDPGVVAHAVDLEEELINDASAHQPVGQGALVDAAWVHRNEGEVCDMEILWPE